MGSTKNWKSAIAAAALASGLVAASPIVADAKAAEPVGDQHCVVEVIGMDRGAFVTGPETCFATEAAAQAHAAGNGSSRSSSGVVGTHYTGTSYTGSSITITGSSCNGGTWTPSGSWNNNIESSKHLCGGGYTTFYDGSNCVTGAYPISSDRVSLGSMNNRTSCVRYG